MLAATLAPWLRHLQGLFVAVDALGLIAFTIIGCNVGLKLGVSTPIVVLAGAITGVCGGMLRDLLCNEIPLVLRQDLYASIALAAGGLYLLLLHWGVTADTASVAVLVSGFATRMLAVRFHWQLKVYSSADAGGAH